MPTLRIFGIVGESVVDGPGLRYTVFTQGCPHRCDGCHNPETHDPSGGYDIEVEEILRQMDKNPLLDGITLSGGEPLTQARTLAPLARAVKERRLSVMLYSGYTFEEILQNDGGRALLSYTDVLVDGKFERQKRSLELPFRGSANQRIIDVAQSLATGQPTAYRLE